MWTLCVPPTQRHMTLSPGRIVTALGLKRSPPSPTETAVVLGGGGRGAGRVAAEPPPPPPPPAGGGGGGGGRVRGGPAAPTPAAGGRGGRAVRAGPAHCARHAGVRVEHLREGPRGGHPVVVAAGRVNPRVERLSTAVEMHVVGSA